MAGLGIVAGWLHDKLHQSLYERDMKALDPMIEAEIASRSAEVAERQSREPDAPVFANVTTVTRMNHHRERDVGGVVDFTMYDRTTLDSVEISGTKTESSTRSSEWIAMRTLELVAVRHTFPVELAPIPLLDLIIHVRERLADVEGEPERQSMPPEALEESRLHRDELLRRLAALRARLR